MTAQDLCGCGCDVQVIDYANESLPINVEEARATEMPPEVGEAFAAAYRLDTPPATFGDWIDAVGARILEDEGELSTDVLCDADGTDDRLELADGESRSFLCVFDALVVPFAEATSGEITTKSPVEETEISISISLQDVTVEPHEAVVSFGAPSDLNPAEENVAERSYETICPVINAFPDQQAYEEWDGQRSVPTTAVPAETAAALAVSVAEALTGDD